MQLGKQRHNHASFMALFLISSIVFIGLLIWTLFSSRIFHWVSLVVTFAPVIGFGAVCFLPRWIVAVKQLRPVIRVAMIVGFVLLTLGNIAAATAFDALAPSRNTLAYTRILKSYGYPDSKGIAHFPQVVPQNAVFYEEPGFGPSGTKIILQVHTDLGAVAGLMERFLPLEQKTPDSEEYFESNMNRSADDLRDAINGYMQLGSSSEEYRTILLKNHAEPDRGLAYGLLVNERSGEIVYWYLDW